MTKKSVIVENKSVCKVGFIYGFLGDASLKRKPDSPTPLLSFQGQRFFLSDIWIAKLNKPFDPIFFFFLSSFRFLFNIDIRKRRRFFVFRINQILYSVSHKIFTVLKEVSLFIYTTLNIICSTSAERVAILQSGIKLPFERYQNYNFWFKTKEKLMFRMEYSIK